MELTTQPYYCCVLGQFGAVLAWAVTGTNVVAELSIWSLVLFVVLSYATLFVSAGIVGKTIGALTASAYE